MVVLFTLAVIRFNTESSDETTISPTKKRDKHPSDQVYRLRTNTIGKTDGSTSDDYEETQTTLLSNIKSGSSNSRQEDQDKFNELAEIATLSDQSPALKSITTNMAAIIDTINVTMNPESQSKLQRADCCRRRCRNYNNKIFLSSPAVGGAGIIDRVFVISNPREVVDILLTWEDFGFSRFLDENDDNHRASSFVDWVDDYNLILHPQITDMLQSSEYHDWLYIRTNTSPEAAALLERIEAYSFGGKLQPDQQQHHYPGLLWEIRPNFFNIYSVLGEHMQKRRLNLQQSHLNDESDQNKHRTLMNQEWRSYMQPFGDHSPPEGCSYIKPVTAPKEMVDVGTEILRQVEYGTRNSEGASAETRVLRPWIGYFHVRRGDVTLDCDTSLQRIEAFLNCTVGASLSEVANIIHHNKPANSPPPRRQPIILLFSSDERDQRYRTELARLIEQHNRHQHFPLVNAYFNVSAVDLDQLVHTILSKSIPPASMPPTPHYYLYRIIRYLEFERAEIVFRLQLRRTMCPGCTNITLDLVKQNLFEQ